MTEELAQEKEIERAFAMTLKAEKLKNEGVELTKENVAMSDEEVADYIAEFHKTIAETAENLQEEFGTTDKK